ncbi:N-acetyltransferase [Jeotgalibacillus sp. S-D1]|uniref:N-acetyltransferase n=1 Tax=Jeotgalibacillus sp. S-D1 TaxID=2552189 RepID=UPI00105A8D03|nr:N-acetyltransferase [Jeotgalibacillus sp. S-D1]TDL35136.1 N-acetyltransferase [Jeotgalibacillus sp. S-D1]
MAFKVENLRINYKTLEDFNKFREIGLQELSMKEELETNMVENESESPFYGIYLGNKLIARMNLYRRDARFDLYFEPAQDYLELWKLEVLPDYQKKGYGAQMVEFAKSFGLPIKTNPRVQSHDFWEKMGFEKVTYNMNRDLGQNPLVWYPPGVTEQQQ